MKIITGCPGQVLIHSSEELLSNDQTQHNYDWAGKVDMN